MLSLITDTLAIVCKYLPVRTTRALKVVCRPSLLSYSIIRLKETYGMECKHPIHTCRYLDSEKEYCELNEDEFDLTMCYERIFISNEMTIDLYYPDSPNFPAGYLVAQDLLNTGRVEFILDYLQQIHLPKLLQLCQYNIRWKPVLEILMKIFSSKRYL